MTGGSDALPSHVDNPTDPLARPWAGARSAKHRSAVQRNVTALLDALAPDRIRSKPEPGKILIDQYRTPTGCILQGQTAALSISWFMDNSQSFGELQIVVWSGVVSRRGVPKPAEGAAMTQQLMLKPVDGPAWRTADGTEYDTPSLVAHCSALLEAAMRTPPRD